MPRQPMTFFPPNVIVAEGSGSLPDGVRVPPDAKAGLGRPAPMVSARGVGRLEPPGAGGGAGPERPRDPAPPRPPPSRRPRRDG